MYNKSPGDLVKLKILVIYSSGKELRVSMSDRIQMILMLLDPKPLFEKQGFRTHNLFGY
jgi:hypothetical protein